MKKEVVLIVHPIAGDVVMNLILIEEIIRNINLNEPDVVPCAPYYVDCVAMDDEVPEERMRGLNNSIELIKRGAYDTLRLYGNKGITSGMRREIIAAISVGTIIETMTPETENDMFELVLEYKDNYRKIESESVMF